MKKIVFLILIIAFISVLPIFAQQQEMAFGPFDSALSGAGIILEATGFGLVVGGGATASLDLGAALIMMQIAPVCSTTGAWCTQAFMEQTAAEWEAKGLNFDSTEYIDSSRTAAIGTTVFAAGALLTPLIPDVGNYVSLGCTAVAVIWDMIAFYGSRQGWYMDINQAIVTSGMAY